MPSYAAHGATDVGRKRVNNEDAFAIRPGDGLYVVADGMGGHSSGEVAAQLAVGTILGFFKDTTLGEESTWPYAYDENLSFAANKLVTAIATANDQIQAYASGHPESRGMGTTVVAVLIASQTGIGRSVWAFVGATRTEVRKVVWPTRAETTQTALAVLVIVLVLGILVWLLDMVILWAVRLLTGQGG